MHDGEEENEEDQEDEDEDEEGGGHMSPPNAQICRGSTQRLDSTGACAKNARSLHALQDAHTSINFS
jgi:hypothetical protein